MNISRKRMRAMFALILVVTLAALMAACSDQNTGVTEPAYEEIEEVVESIPETLPPVQIKMPDYELTYSGAFQELIQVKELENEQALAFSVKLSKTEEELFVLRYNTDEGDLVTIVEDAKGNRIPVAFLMREVPGNLSKEDIDLFCSAQEAVNEIVASLTLK